MLNQCLENTCEGLLHACISSIFIKPNQEQLRKNASYRPIHFFVKGFWQWILITKVIGYFFEICVHIPRFEDAQWQCRLNSIEQITTFIQNRAARIIIRQDYKRALTSVKAHVPITKTRLSQSYSQSGVLSGSMFNEQRTNTTHYQWTTHEHYTLLMNNPRTLHIINEQPTNTTHY